jgi:hypothetical protein
LGPKYSPQYPMLWHFQCMFFPAKQLSSKRMIIRLEKKFIVCMEPECLCPCSQIPTLKSVPSQLHPLRSILMRLNGACIFISSTYCLWFYYPDNIRWSVQIMELPIVSFHILSSYF